MMSQTQNMPPWCFCAGSSGEGGPSRSRIAARQPSAVCFGRQKVNLQPAGWDYALKAREHVAGSQDVCLIVEGTLEPVIRHLEACGIPIAEGPVGRTGATGPIRSVYFRDPDGNLVEISTYRPE